MPKEQAQKYGVCSAMPIWALSSPRDLRTVRRLSTIQEKYQRIIGVDLDRVPRDYDIKRDNFDDQEKFKEAVDGWWTNVWSKLPREEALKYTIRLPSLSDQLELEPALSKGARYVKRAHVDYMRGMFNVTRDQFETEKDYNETVMTYWYNVWEVMADNALRDIEGHSSAIGNLPVPDLHHTEGYRTMHGIHLESVQRDCGFTREQFGTEEEYNNAVTSWWKNIWAYMPPEEAQRYALFSPDASNEETHDSEPQFRSSPKTRKWCRTVIGIRVDRVRRKLGLNWEDRPPESRRGNIAGWWINLRRSLPTGEARTYAIQFFPSLAQLNES